MKAKGLWGNRVMLMTRMASFEANEGKQAIRICNYFRSDYVTLNVVRSAVAATVAFFLLGGLYIYYNVDMLLQEIYSIDIIEMGRTTVTAYIIFVGTFALISYVVYSFRYDRARKSLRDYNNALKSLSEMAGGDRH